jgi:hypothetical protein
MSPEAESPPPRGGTAILAPAAPASARAAAAAVGARAHRRGDGGTGRAPRLMTGGSDRRVLIA